MPREKDWAALTQAIRTRIRQMGLHSPKALAAVSPIAAETWAKVLDDDGPLRSDAIGRMEEFLGGEPGTFDEVLAGKPVRWGPLPAIAPPSHDRTRALESEIRQQLGALREKVDVLDTRMATIERLLPRPPGKTARRSGRAS